MERSEGHGAALRHGLLSRCFRRGTPPYSNELGDHGQIHNSNLLRLQPKREPVNIPAALPINLEDSSEIPTIVRPDPRHVLRRAAPASALYIPNIELNPTCISYTWMSPSAPPVASHRPLGQKARANSDSVWSAKTLKHSPVAEFQIRVVASLAHVAMSSSFPGSVYGHHCTCTSSAVCPLYTTLVPVCKFHVRAVPSSEQLARDVEEGLHSTWLMSFVWPLESDQ